MSVEEVMARLERAEGPDRELDAEVHSIATGDAVFSPWDGEYAEFIRYNETTYVLPSDTGNQLPAYTASLDAALSLVPDDLFYLLSKGRIKPEDPNEPLYAVELIRGNGENFYVFSDAEHAANLALAVCIAALRARQVQP